MDWALQVALVVKNLAANAGDIRDTGWIPRLGRPPGEEMATHFSVVAWEVLWGEDPGGLQPTGLQRVGHV